MKIIHADGRDDVARVFVAKLEDGARIEFVESVQRPITRNEKWVLIVSTLKGCPVKCPICDAGGAYGGTLSRDEILDQIRYLIRSRYPNGRPPSKRIKIQFARMGDPAFNNAVLDVLEALPTELGLDVIQPSISTVAPFGRDPFFERLLDIKNRRYSKGRFQMQFSLHTTDMAARRTLVPIKTWSLERMAAYGDRFVEPGDLKISLNFAPVHGYPLDPALLREQFDPKKFLVKLTPVNPTFASEASGLRGLIVPTDPRSGEAVAAGFRERGFDVIVSIGDTEENRIGSNCGMFVSKCQKADQVA